MWQEAERQKIEVAQKGEDCEDTDHLHVRMLEARGDEASFFGHVVRPDFTSMAGVSTSKSPSLCSLRIPCRVGVSSECRGS